MVNGSIPVGHVATSDPDKPLLKEDESNEESSNNEGD